MKHSKYKNGDDFKSAMSFIQRILRNNLTYDKYRWNNQQIADAIYERLKDICNWIARPCGEKYWDDVWAAYYIYCEMPKS